MCSSQSSKALELAAAYLQITKGTKETNKNEGNLSLITVKDLFQLKPVFDKRIFENTNDSYSALATNIWNEYFTLFELTEIMRQKEIKRTLQNY